MASASPAPAPTVFARARASGSVYFAALKVPFTLAFLFASALAAYYIFYVIQERDYLVGRNFRLLATMGEQIERAIDGDRRILTNTLRGASGSRDAAERAIKANAAYIPLLRHAELRPASERTAGNPATFRVVDKLRNTWSLGDEAASGRTWFVQVPLQHVLQPVLADQTDEGSFDTVIVAAADGRVLFQSGDPVLRIVNLTTLTAAGDPKTDIRAKFEALGRAPGSIEVLVSGTRYRLFTQPCCGLVQEDAPSRSTGWVLCGLTRTETLRAQSYAVPFPIMALLGAALALALLSWPFVKLLFIGEAQRIRAQDAALVGLCTLMGAATIAIAVLAVYASTVLSAKLDAQLQAFAVQIKSQVGEETEAAAEQLARLDAAAAEGKLPEGEVVKDLARRDEAITSRYPLFEAFTLVDEHGQQKRKMSPGGFVPPVISVAEREYFQYWQRPASGADVFFQAIQSATTGRQEVVLSRPAKTSGFKVATLSIPMRALIDPVIVPGFGFAIIRDDGSVLFHSDPQHTKSENFFLESDQNRRLRALVAARRTESVNVKYWADDHRAFVTPMKMLGQPLTLVTFYDKALVRAVTVEWLVVVLVFLLLYASVYTIVAVALLVVRPRYRAPWLWPDPEGSRRYLDLLPSLLLLTLAFIVALATVAPGDLLLVAGLLPFFAWTLVYLVLQRRSEWRALAWPALAGLSLLVPLLVLAWRADPRPWGAALALLILGSGVQAVASARRQGTGRTTLAPPPNLSYSLAAAFLLLLTAVFPAVAFATVGYRTQIETFVKHGQLQFAVDHSRRELRDRQEDFTEGLRAARRAQGAERWGVYSAFFFPPRAEQPADAEACTPPKPEERDPDRDTRLPENIEELLPFYSEASVRLRELAHDVSEGRDWWWRHAGDDLVFCAAGTNGIRLRATLPDFLDGPPDSRLVLLALGWIAILAAVMWSVRFIVHNIFVADVIEPLWSGSDAPRETWGPNLFLVSAGPPRYEVPHGSYCEIDLARAPAADPELGRWFDEQFARIERSPAGHGVLIAHFEERLEDAGLNEYRLALLEHIIDALDRTIVIVSAVPPSAATRARLASSSDEPAGPAADSMRRWADVLSRFTIVPVMPVEPAHEEPSPISVLGNWTSAGWREIVWRMNALGFAYSSKFLERERDDPQVDRLWKAVLPYAWHPERPPLDLGQLLVEVGERAEHHYRQIWATCTPAEKLVLVHLAQEGLVNRKTKATVRRLMARGLIRREPHFVLVNETFRRFVLSASSQDDIALLETSSASAWDAIRLPFLAALVGSLVFLFVTQHELYNTTLGIVTSVTAAVPAVMKLASLFGERRAQA